MVNNIKSAVIIVVMIFMITFFILRIKTEGNVYVPRLWHYQLQDYNCDLVEQWEYPYVVVDPDEFNCSLPDGDVKVLAYLSIGEAEDYRGYWDSMPKDIVLYENPEWKGNFAVKFWDNRWKKIVFERLTDVLNKGFDGVYLDKVDIYEEIGHRDGMVSFVCEIYRTVKKANPESLVFVQNAWELYSYIKGCLDGLGTEDIWFYDDKYIGGKGLSLLRQALGDGITVLVVDYPQDRENVCTFYRLCKKEGFFCTVNNRELNLDEPVTCSS